MTPLEEFFADQPEPPTPTSTFTPEEIADIIREQRDTQEENP